MIITSETIKNTKIPTLQRKYELALTGAQFIVEIQNDFAIVNSLYKQLYKMTVIAAEYLHLTERNNEVISGNEFDDLSLSNIFGQIKSLTYQTDKDLSGKAKAILRDYHIFEDMLNTEIENEINRQNDLLSRLDKEVALNATPEMLEQIEQQKQEVFKQIERQKRELNLIDENDENATE